jgi:hypothetical protein
MEIKHTSGPWFFDRESMEITTGHFMQPIAVVRGWGWISKNKPQFEAIAIQEANGILLSSAPELLEVLMEAQTLLTKTEIYPIHHPIYVKMANAIERATQQTPK